VAESHLEKPAAQWPDRQDDLSEVDLSGANLNGIDLHGANLSYANLYTADLRAANLSHADLSGADLCAAQLVSAKLNQADLSGADLSRANLLGADLRGANLTSTTLGWADLTNANLSGADLSDADLSDANLRNANLSGAVLSDANLSGAVLSSATGLLNAIDWMAQNLERTDVGYVVYKQFGNYYKPSSAWEVAPGAILQEVVNPSPTRGCGCGINVAIKGWQGFVPNKPIWRCLIRWEWLPGVVVPYDTNGKFRCARCEVLEEC